MRFPYKCLSCDGFTARNLNEWKIHKETNKHNIVHWNECEYCDIEFDYPSLLLRHNETSKHKKVVNEVENTSTFRCEECDKNFDYYSKFQRHFLSKKCIRNCEIVHHNKYVEDMKEIGEVPEPLYYCDICERDYKTKSKLQRHYKTKKHKKNCSLHK